MFPHCSIRPRAASAGVPHHTLLSALELHPGEAVTALGGSSSWRSSQICPILWGAEANLLRLCTQKASSGRVRGSSRSPWYSPGSFLADQDTPFMFC